MLRDEIYVSENEKRRARLLNTEELRAGVDSRKFFPNLRFRHWHEPADARMGRFGGGWQWVIAVKVSRVSLQKGTIILQLLVFSIQIRWGP